jgi:hypothetical protein
MPAQVSAGTIPSVDDQPVPTTHHRRLVRPRSRSDEKLESQLNAAVDNLLEQLVSYLSRLPEPRDDDDDDDDDLCHNSVTEAPGLTLPASAIGWLTLHIYPFQNTRNDDDREATSSSGAEYPLSASQRIGLTRLKQLLTRLTHLRITKANSWPENIKLKQYTPCDGPPFSATRPFVESILYRPRIDLRLFPNCRILLLDQVAPDCILNLPTLRRTLRALRIERCCIYSLPELLLQTSSSSSSKSTTKENDKDPLRTSTTPTINDLGRYSKLTHLKMSYCGLNGASGLRGNLVQLPPLARMMHLTSVCLSHNELSSQRSVVAGLANKPFLTSLDLSYNHLRSFQYAAKSLSNLTTLNLSNNQLSHTRGIDSLVSLQTLHVDCNRIADLASMAGLTTLRELRNLLIQGNPAERDRPQSLRVDMLDLFREQRMRLLPTNASFRQVQNVLPLLDGKLANIGELKAIRDRTYLRPEAIVFASADEGWVRVERRVDGLDAIQVGLKHGRRHRKRRRQATISPLDRHAETFIEENQADPNFRIPVSFSLEDVVSSLALRLSSTEPDEVDGEENSQCLEDVSFSGDDALIEARDSASYLDDPSLTPPSHVGGEVTPCVDIIDSDFTSDMLSATISNRLSTLEVSYDGMEQGNVDKSQEDEYALPLGPVNSDAILPFELPLLTPSKNEEDEDTLELKQSAATTVTTADTIDEHRSLTASPQLDETLLHLGALNGSGDADERENASPSHIGSDHSSEPSQSPYQQNFRHVASFGGLLHNISMSSGLGSPPASVAPENKFLLAEDHVHYEGPKLYSNVNVLDNLDLYFRVYVFDMSRVASLPDTGDDEWKHVVAQYPKIQLWPVDRRYREAAKEKALLAGKTALNEDFRRVWREKVVACGQPALRRLTPNRRARYGFHGELLWSSASTAHLKPETIAESRDVIMCLTDQSLYILLDHDSVTEKAQGQDRAFPLPIPLDATFSHSKWPHALAFHPLQTLRSIVIGFGFQRLTLHFANTTYPVPDDFAYVLLTSNKASTITLLKEIQTLANEAKAAAALAVTECEVVIENDDRQVLDALGAALSPESIDSVLHYQVLSQRWKSGDRGFVRRVCVVADAKLFLLDEDYEGDGSASMDARVGRRLGEVAYRLVDSSDLQHVKMIQAADAHPSSITVSIAPLNRLQRMHNWRLMCRDRIGAERLVEDIRKAVALSA